MSLDEPTPPPPQNGRNSPAGALDSAIALLRVGLRPDGSYEGVPEGEVSGHQWRILGAWAAQQGFIVASTLGPEQEGGAEHDLAYRGGRWLKFTKPFQAGYAVEVVEQSVLMLPATPLQYLRRWKICNSYFGDSVELVGVSAAYGGLRLVISQPDLSGDAPTWSRLHQAFTVDFGLRQLSVPGKLFGGYESRAYFGGRIGVFDVRPPNCVVTNTDVVVPIDIITQAFSRQDSNVLQSLTVDGDVI